MSLLKQLSASFVHVRTTSLCPYFDNVLVGILARLERLGQPLLGVEEVAEQELRDAEQLLRAGGKVRAGKFTPFNTSLVNLFYHVLLRVLYYPIEQKATPGSTSCSTEHSETGPDTTLSRSMPAMSCQSRGTVRCALNTVLAWRGDAEDTRSGPTPPEIVMVMSH